VPAVRPLSLTRIRLVGIWDIMPAKCSLNRSSQSGVAPAGAGLPPRSMARCPGMVAGDFFGLLEGPTKTDQDQDQRSRSRKGTIEPWQQFGKIPELTEAPRPARFKKDVQRFDEEGFRFVKTTTQNLIFYRGRQIWGFRKPNKRFLFLQPICFWLFGYYLKHTSVCALNEIPELPESILASGGVFYA
jgi:hypothetical protein